MAVWLRGRVSLFALMVAVECLLVGYGSYLGTDLSQRLRWEIDVFHMLVLAECSIFIGLDASRTLAFCSSLWSPEYKSKLLLCSTSYLIDLAWLTTVAVLHTFSSVMFLRTSLEGTLISDSILVAILTLLAKLPVVLGGYAIGLCSHVWSNPTWRRLVTGLLAGPPVLLVYLYSPVLFLESVSLLIGPATYEGANAGPLLLFFLPLTLLIYTSLVIATTFMDWRYVLIQIRRASQEAMEL